MKHILKFILSLSVICLSITACEKVDDNKTFADGTAPVLSASATTLAPTATDSLNTVVTFSWTNPNYANDSATTKYVLEIDSAGKDFTRAATKTVIGALSTSMLAKELNSVLLGFGFSFNVAYDVDVRLTSSYGNNNERLHSNIIRIKATPYKIPPRVPLPATLRLFMVGGATDFGWDNTPAPPAFPPVRELTRMDETTWSGIYNLNGTQGYKILQEQGNWNTQFHALNGGDAFNGSFEQANADPWFPAPATAGPFKVTLDFQQGKYIVTSVPNALPAELYITGDGTPSGWTNSPPPAQKLTGITNGIFEITMAFTPGKLYKFLSSPGNWQPQFGGSSATGGTLGANYGSGSDPDAIPTPSVAGNYKIRLNFLTGTYTVTQL